ncbi:SIS domain-containing protein [Erysipelothrix sp. HDW6C]|uniref:SIS domain-containing protein n=1 Tax=Erysipelothrix sp. HDW6C TaxID=2714930 RepID=UPI001408C199|nr:SIS domain-containing protein [Erysipelothrix sp. HDW6C]QIK69433.1 SIS domain-containing protein [Erysipelothrix sp. HDW6C]
MDKMLTDFSSTLRHEINANIDRLNFEAITQAADLIIQQESKGNRVHVTGVGKPGHVAGYIASLLSSTGTSAYELNATEAVHGSSGQVKPGDVVIAISNSGETVELKATVETLKRNGSYIISCTQNKESWLGRQSDVCLEAFVSQEGDTLNKPPRASIVSEIIVLQCLSVVLQDAKNLNSQEYLKWHPGGSLGASIRHENEKEDCE